MTLKNGDRRAIPLADIRFSVKRRSPRPQECQHMPYVNVQITRGATRDQKSAIVKDITESLVRNLDKKPEHIHIVIQEIAEEDWGFSGMLTDDWKRKQLP